MNKIQWSCSEFGEHGFVFIAADLQLSCGALLGLRQAVHPFDVDKYPQLLVRTIAEMSDVMGRVSAQPLSASRAHAFGTGQGDQYEAACA